MYRTITGMPTMAERMAMFSKDTAGGESSGGASPTGRGRRMTSAKVKASDQIQKIVDNDPNTTAIDLTGSTIYQMKHVEYTKKLSAGLAKNTHLTSLTLENCGLQDADAELLAEALKENRTLVCLNLCANGIKDAGCIALARAFAVNDVIREFNIFKQSGVGKWGESTLSEWLKAYETNVTLLKIVWSTASKQTVRLTGMLARNTDINRAVEKGLDYEAMLPASLKANPPKLTFYKLPDIKETRGDVAEVASPGRRTQRGMVMRNGVADKVASSGTVLSRLAALRGEEAPAVVAESVPKENEPVLATYTCVKKSQIRAGFEMSTDKAGLLLHNEDIEIFESRVNADGITRVRFDRGWVSATSATGDKILQFVKGTELVKSLVPSTAITLAPAPATTSAPQLAKFVLTAVEKKFKCIKKSQIRAGPAMDSDKYGVLQVGTVVIASATTVLTLRDDQQPRASISMCLCSRCNVAHVGVGFGQRTGQTRVRFATSFNDAACDGWVSIMTSAGDQALAEITAEDDEEAAARAAQEQAVAEAARLAKEQEEREAAETLAAARMAEEEVAAAEKAAVEAAARAAREEAEAEAERLAKEKEKREAAEASAAAQRAEEESARVAKEKQEQETAAAIVAAADAVAAADENDTDDSEPLE